MQRFVYRHVIWWFTYTIVLFFFFLIPGKRFFFTKKTLISAGQTSQRDSLFCWCNHPIDGPWEKTKFSKFEKNWQSWSHSISSKRSIKNQFFFLKNKSSKRIDHGRSFRLNDNKKLPRLDLIHFLSNVCFKWLIVKKKGTQKNTSPLSRY